MQYLGNWMHFLSAISHTATCKKPQCAMRPTPAYLSACRARMEPIYLMTLGELKQISPTGSPFIESWEKFGTALGLSEVMLLAKWKSEQECCYPMCKRRSDKKSSSKMNACAACKSVYYHDRSCQKAYVK